MSLGHGLQANWLVSTFRILGVIIQTRTFSDRRSGFGLVGVYWDVYLGSFQMTTFWLQIVYILALHIRTIVLFYILIPCSNPWPAITYNFSHLLQVRFTPDIPRKYSVESFHLLRMFHCMLSRYVLKDILFWNFHELFLYYYVLVILLTRFLLCLGDPELIGLWFCCVHKPCLALWDTLVLLDLAKTSIWKIVKWFK